jgi:IclR family KDG regulon transcriptional repressor
MTVKSADRVLKVLETIAHGQPISAPQLREMLDIPRSSLHGLMRALIVSRFVAVDERGNYRVGIKAFEVGATWLESVRLENVARPVLKSLVQELNQIAHLGVLEGTDIIYVMKQENESPVRLISAVGRRLPAHATALGKVLLGALSDQEISERYQDVALDPLTSASVTSLSELLARVSQARQEGLSIDAGESTVGVTCYAAPIIDRNQKVVAALSVSVIDTNKPEHSQAQYGKKIREAAQEISRQIGGD